MKKLSILVHALLFIFLMIGAANADYVGTIGTRFTIAGSGFGAQKSIVYLEYEKSPGRKTQVKAKVESWSDTSIACLWKTKIAAGDFNLFVKPKAKGSSPIPKGSFRIMNPVIDEVKPVNFSVGNTITIKGHYFSTKKPTVYIKDATASKKKTCKVLSSTMNQNTGESTLQFVVPKLVFDKYKITLKTQIGEATFLKPLQIEAQQTIGSNGGGIFLPNGASIVIPAGALSSNTEIRMTATNKPPADEVPEEMLVSNDGMFYILEPTGTLLNAKAEITLPYGNLPWEPTAIDLVTSFFDGQKWVRLPVKHIDADNKTVTFETNHFTTFNVTYNSLYPEKQYQLAGNKVDMIKKDDYLNFDFKLEDTYLRSARGYIGGTIFNYNPKYGIGYLIKLVNASRTQDKVIRYIHVYSVVYIDIFGPEGRIKFNYDKGTIEEDKLRSNKDFTRLNHGTDYDDDGCATLGHYIVVFDEKGNQVSADTAEFNDIRVCIAEWSALVQDYMLHPTKSLKVQNAIPLSLMNDQDDYRLDIYIESIYDGFWNTSKVAHYWTEEFKKSEVETKMLPSIKITSPSKYDYTEDDAISLAAEAEDPFNNPLPASSVSWYDVENCADAGGYSLNSTTPVTFNYGIHHIKAVAVDEFGAGAASCRTIRVKSTRNSPPEITSTPPSAVTVGETYTYQVEYDDPDGDNATVSLENAPLAMTLTTKTRTLQWTPAVSDVGTITFTVVLRDGRGGEDRREVTITVQPKPNACPKATMQVVSSPADTNEAVYLICNASDKDGNALSYNWSTNGGTLFDVSGDAAFFKSNYAGNFKVACKVSDGQCTITEYGYITVQEAPQPDEKPSAPTGLTANAISPWDISLSWNPSDNNAAGYKILRDGTNVGSVIVTSTTDTWLSPSMTYCYVVVAYSKTGKESDPSNQACDMTKSYSPTPQPCTYTYSDWGACQPDSTQTRTVISSSPPGCTGTPVLSQACTYIPPSDNQPPSVPTGLTATAVSSNQINLSWNASPESDVAGYKIYRNGSWLKNVTSGTSTLDTGLSPSTPYCYTVSAYDVATNESGQSSQACATTQAVTPPPPGTYKLPDSGQTTCYEGGGSIIACPPPGDPLAQDGSYNINPLFYTDNGNGTVLDNNTGLIWQREDDGQTRTWDEAMSYCDGLPLGGYSEWRLPSKKELISIVNYDIPYPGPTIDSVFTNTEASYYWSSATLAYYPGYTWSVYFGDGYVSHGSKDYGMYVRCARGGQTPTALQDNDNGTVTDTKTGLMWQQGENSPMTWEDALSFCEGLYLGGHSDWRLPNIKELESLTDDTRYDPAIDATFFPNAQSSYYWSSTTGAGNPDDAWDVHFYDGGVGSSYKYYGMYVRCARGGQ